MPKVTFSSENKVKTSNYDYPKLRLDKDEKALLVLLEDPEVEYVHTLRKPKLENGKPVMITKPRKDKTTYETYDLQFISRPLCKGDFTILQDKGLDPKNCPMCALAHENSEYTDAPQRRYAMNVIRYRTKGSGYDLINPFSVELLVWSFTDRYFNQLIDFKEEWGDLRKHDLKVECTNKDFQNFDIQVASKAQWLADADRKAIVKETFKENKLEDISIAIGQNKEDKWVKEDIESIREAWGAIKGTAQADDGWYKEDEDDSLAEDLNSILDDDDETEDSVVESKPAAKKEKKKTSKKKEEPEEASSDEEINFDDLLNDLDD